MSLNAAAGAPPEPALNEIDRRTELLIAVTLVVSVLAVFGSVVTHKFVVLDDLEYIVENPHVVTGLTPANIAWAWRAMYAANWHPMTWMSHMLDVQVFGLHAGAHLLVSVMLHAATTVLLFFFLARATNRRWPSAAVAALFALHPLHVESVAWASERKDVLSAFFFVVALLFYLRYVRANSRAQYAATLLAFALGLASKPMLVTFPFVLLLLDWWPLRRPLRTNLLVEKLPFFALSIFSSFMTMRAQQEAMAAFPLSMRLSNATLSYVAYLGKAVWPLHLAVIYPLRRQILPSAIAAALIVLVIITAVCAAAARRSPYLLVGWLWFLGTLVPVIGIVQVGLQAMADRYTYIPLIGPSMAVVWLIADFVSSRRVTTVGATIVLTCLAVLTFLQVGYWRDSVTLFRRSIAAVPGNGPAHVYLATALQRTDRRTAIAECREALKINPNDDNARAVLAITLNAAGETASAMQEARLAVTINPRNASASKTLGILELRAGNRQEALQSLQRSLALESDPETAAAAAAAAGQTDQAIAQYQEVLQYKEGDADLRNNLAALLAESGRDAEALTEYRTALRLDPRFYDVHMNLGALLSRMGNDAEAAKEFAAAAKLRPESGEPHVYLALIYAQTGQFRQAVAEVDAGIAADRVATNQQLTNAIRIPFKETNIEEYRAFLESKAGGK